MSGSIFGTRFQISTWGESHGKALGVTIDGCPAGLFLSEEDVQKELDRRRPGQNPFGTMRQEADAVTILSGVFEGRTTGTPIAMIVYNKDHHSTDYGNLATCFRPGHADYTFTKKYGFRDYRGGGRSSGRETLSRVAAGAVAKKLLQEMGISLLAYTSQIGPICCETFLEEEIKKNPLCMPDAVAYEKAATFLEQCKKDQNSAGGVVCCRVDGVPAGLGAPVFEKLDALLAQAMLSIGAVKGFEMGDGFAASCSTGFENNDFFTAVNGTIQKETNHSGGVLGGISDGSPLFFRVAFKPTPSIAKAQPTVDETGSPLSLSIHGRHDPTVVPRAVVVVEAMAALVLVDLLMENATSSMDRLLAAYGK